METNLLPLRLSGTLTCASAAERDLVQRYLPEHTALTRQEPGCLSFEVNPTSDPMVWRVEETFVDKDAFEAHQKRTRLSDWGIRTSAIARAYRVTTGDDLHPDTA